MVIVALLMDGDQTDPDGEAGRHVLPDRNFDRAHLQNALVCMCWRSPHVIPL